MPHIIKRRSADSIDDRLARVLDSPLLVRIVPYLPPETLHQLVRVRGLDACGEIVTAATAAQLNALLDLDLWRHTRPGRDEQLDVDRFGEWLEVLAETGASVAARTVAALDKDLVIAGLSRYVRVFDPGIFEPTAQSDDEPMDRNEAMREGDAVDNEPSEAGLECEVAGYRVRARRPDAWDAIVTLLVALDAEHGDDFHAVMEGCRDLSNSRPEVDGLDDLLPVPEQHLHDVASGRAHRRAQQGYATPADARAFLEMARRPRQAGSHAPTTATMKANPIAAAYFRAADGLQEPANAAARSQPQAELPVFAASPSRSSRSSDGEPPHVTVPETVDAVIDVLIEAGLMPERPRRLLDAASGGPGTASVPLLKRLMEFAREHDEAGYLVRSRELAFLANVLLAGGSIQSRPFTPQEASEAAAAVCNLGIECWPGRWPSPSPPDSWLLSHDLVTAFEVGWSVLHEDVSLFTLEQLISLLTNLRPADRELRREFVALRRRLVTERNGRTPWRAREALENLAMLDMTAWVALVGLLDECPHVPAALNAVVDGRTTAVSPMAFEFISTVDQIGDVRAFLQKLPDVLSG